LVREYGLTIGCSASNQLLVLPAQLESLQERPLQTQTVQPLRKKYAVPHALVVAASPPPEDSVVASASCSALSFAKSSLSFAQDAGTSEDGAGSEGMNRAMVIVEKCVLSEEVVRMVKATLLVLRLSASPPLVIAATPRALLISCCSCSLQQVEAQSRTTLAAASMPLIKFEMILSRVV